MSADATLKAAQALYESKAITYPRTDSRHLGSDMKAQIPRILGELRSLKPAEIGKLDFGALAFTARIIDDKKVSDHHAIIPTGKPPGSFSPAEKKVYDAIVVRLSVAH
jgi:DNA topoisomerase-3